MLFRADFKSNYDNLWKRHRRGFMRASLTKKEKKNLTPLSLKRKLHKLYGKVVKKKSTYCICTFRVPVDQEETDEVDIDLLNLVEAESGSTSGLSRKRPRRARASSTASESESNKYYSNGIKKKNKKQKTEKFMCVCMFVYVVVLSTGRKISNNCFY